MLPSRERSSAATGVTSPSKTHTQHGKRYTYPLPSGPDSRDRVSAGHRQASAPSLDEPGMTGRAYIESEVARRAVHQEGEDVRTTVSFATAERLFGHEYHGRFLIELLQNAADAWGERDGRSRLEIVVGEGPALLVANQGAPFPATIVIESLGHIGRSPKVQGQTIGHKGIGFKSVLEISAAPEVYSGFAGGDPSSPSASTGSRRLRRSARLLRTGPSWQPSRSRKRGASSRSCRFSGSRSGSTRFQRRLRSSPAEGSTR